MAGNRIIVLVGPKGSGKTYLGLRMRDELGFHYLEVERIWLELKAERNLSRQAFDREGIRRVLLAIASSLTASSNLVIDSTGAAPWFDEFAQRLKDLARVEFVKVVVPLDECLRRIARRDASIHLPASRNVIERAHAISAALELPWVDVVSNGTEVDADAFLRRIAGPHL
jgi:shikimate kinase